MYKRCAGKGVVHKRAPMFVKSIGRRAQHSTAQHSTAQDNNKTTIGQDRTGNDRTGEDRTDASFHI